MKRALGFINIAIVYIIAFIAGYLVFISLNQFDHLVKIAVADIVATLVVYLFGVFFQNSSLYDPYWSVAPLVIVPCFINRWDFSSILMLMVIYYWGIRLTLNWAYTFQSLKFQDWRYDYFKKSFPLLWPLLNLFGINLMPTLIVFGVMMPSFRYLEVVNKINLITISGAIISILSVFLQLFADIQMHRFRKYHQGQVNDKGLWKYSRHPNYLGEIMMWWGVYIMMISVSINDYLLFVGPLINTLMFIFISIPLMEKRQLKNKSQYNDYISKTSMLLLLPNKKHSIKTEQDTKLS